MCKWSSYFALPREQLRCPAKALESGPIWSPAFPRAAARGGYELGSPSRLNPWIRLFRDTDPLSTKRLPKAIGDGQQRISPLKNYGNPEGRIGTEAREDLELRQIATDHDRTRRCLALAGNCDRSRRFATVGMQRRAASGRQTPVVEHKGSGMRRCRFVGLRAPITSGYGGLHFSTAASRLGCAVVFENFRPIASRHALQESLSS